jgi:hypothetical protein
LTRKKSVSCVFFLCKLEVTTPDLLYRQNNLVDIWTLNFESVTKKFPIKPFELKKKFKFEHNTLELCYGKLFAQREEFPRIMANCKEITNILNGKNFIFSSGNFFFSQMTVIIGKNSPISKLYVSI